METHTTTTAVQVVRFIAIIQGLIKTAPPVARPTKAVYLA